MSQTIEDYLFATLLLHSFRYSLGRKTVAVIDCVGTLKKYWKVLPVFLQEQIQRDIKSAIAVGCAGNKCDVDRWQQIMSLKINEE